MSDRSSESSCEWVVLNEDEEELVLDNIEQSLNLELSYEGISHAVSDSIRSSLSSEELEWQYEQYENYIPPNRPSFIQEVDSRDFDDTEDCQSEDSNVEDDIINKWVSTSDIEEEDIADVAPVSKIYTYKHKRNDHLNFILNLSLALVLASAIGLGIGHFLGWSHKCFKSTSVGHKAADSIELPPAVIFEQVKEGNGHSKDKNLPLFSENLLNSVPCTGLKSEDSSAPHDISSTSMNSNIAIDSGLTETSLIMASDVFEFKAQDKLLPNNFSNPFMLNISPESDVSTKIDWNELSSLEAVAKIIYGLKEVSSINADIDSPIEEEVNDVKLELLPRNDVKRQLSDENDAAYDSEIPFFLNENDNLFSESKLNSNEFEFLKGYFNREKVSDSENNFTNQLRKDLNEVVQSLAAVALARLTDINEKYPASVEESELILKLFSDFQTLINTKITDIDNLVNSIEYKDASKFNVKYLQKMVYTLVDSVDYLMKISFKTLSKDGRKINVHKFSNNITKVMLNFNKKWEKNTRFWSEALEKFKIKKFREGNFKKGKENKYSKNKPQFEKHSKKSFKYRNSMKS